MATVSFIKPMLLKPSAAMPVGKQWLYEMKFDGFSGLATTSGKDVQIFSRNGSPIAKVATGRTFCQE